MDVEQLLGGVNVCTLRSVQGFLEFVVNSLEGSFNMSTFNSRAVTAL